MSTSDERENRPEPGPPEQTAYEPAPSAAPQPSGSQGPRPSDPYAQPPRSGQQPASGQQPQHAQQPASGQHGYGPPPYAQPQYNQQYGQSQYGAPSNPKNWMNTVGLVLSILGLFTWITAIAGVVLGHMGLSAVKRGEADNRGQGVAALVVGYIIIGLGILGIIAAIAFFGWFVNECGGDNPASWCTDLDTQ